ncbi:MAG: ribosomal protein S18-alanine N-acetyltransferase [Lachnospiraceae bacterium]|nr:ribosomal protein S18-alanine N-acetyltransferase [Lachnospiraceae bacterium]
MLVRTATQNDIPYVHGIERVCFSDPWSLESISGFLNEKGRSVFVAENEGTIIGYGVTMQVLDECEILRVAVKNEFRKKGVGNILLGEMIAKAFESGTRLYFLEVRESNIPAIALYRKHGFIESGLRKDYYTAPVENAVLMSKCVAGTGSG